MIDDQYDEMYDNYKTKTTGAEAFSLYSLKTLPESTIEEDISLYGLQNNSQYIHIKYVKKIISIHSKDKKEFIQLLTQKIIEFSNEQDSCSYQDIVDEFGSPNEVAGSYIETLNSDEIIKKLNKKKIINIFISVIIILCISVWGFERYRINQLIDEAKHTKMKTYTAEEYKEKIAKEKQEK